METDEFILNMGPVHPSTHGVCRFKLRMDGETIKAVEELAEIEVPLRAEYIRVLAMELNRIINHLVFMGSLLIDLGASTMIMYGFREREKALQLFEMLCGARLTFNYIRPGRVREDLPEAFIPKLNEFMKH